MDALWPMVARSVSNTGDDSFGPTSQRWFDFTIKFEEIIFGILPTCFLLVLAPFFLTRHRRRPVTAAADAHLWFKLIISAIIALLEVAAAALRNTATNGITLDTTLPTHVLACIAAFAMTTLLYHDHRYAIQSSAFISIYFFVTMLLDAAKSRSFFLRGGSRLQVVACIYAVVAAMKLGLVILAEVPKHYQQWSRKTLGKEAVSGFWNRTFFIWLNSTLFFGFRNRLLVDDLPNMGPEFHSTTLAIRFEPIWMRYKGSSHRLIKASARVLVWPLVTLVPARLFRIAFSFSQPFVIQGLLEYAGTKNKSSERRNALIVAYIISNLGTTLSTVWCQHLNYRLVTLVRGLLSSRIFKKNLSVTHKEAKKSAATTLMSTDISGIAEDLPKLQDVWACPIELGVAIYLLSILIGKSAFLVIPPAILSTLASAEFARRFSLACAAWNKAIEIRVAKTTSVLQQIKGIKMMGLESKVGSLIQRLRDTEVVLSKSARRLHATLYTCGPIAFAFTPILVIAGGLFWTKLRGGLDVTQTFTTLAFTSLAIEPIFTILSSWAKVGALAACIGRIEAFLLLQEKSDRRSLGSEGAVLDDDVVIRVQEVKKEPLDQYPIQFSKASIAPLDSEKAVVHIDAAIERSTTTMVVGSTGCGKSTLLKSVVGDSNVVHGFVYVAQENVAYCGEEVWIRDITIRDNIVGENPFDEALYNKVVYACMLGDVDEFPDGDLTRAGNGGNNLSGGQKQRIALARAIYARLMVLVMEDMLSAVDRPSAVEILERLFGPEGLLKQLGTTVVMATHSVEYLEKADAVLIIDDNGQGTLKTSQRAISQYISKHVVMPDITGVSDGATDDVSAARHYKPTPPKDETSESLHPTGDWSLYRFYLGSMNKRVVALWILMTAIAAVLERSPDIFIRIWVEHAPEDKQWFIGYVMVGVACLIGAGSFTGVFLIYLVPESSKRLHKMLLDSVMNASFLFLNYADNGNLLNRFSQDMSLLSQDLPMALLVFIYTTFLGLTDLGIIFAGARFAAVLLPLVAGILFVVQLYYLRSSKQIRLLDIEAKSPLYKLVTEMSSGLQHIHAFGWEQVYFVKALAILDHSQKPFYYMYCIQRWLLLVLGICVTAISAVLVSFALTFSEVSQPALGLALLTAMKIGQVLADTIEFWVDLETSLGAVSRLFTFVRETPQEESDEEDEQDETVPHNWPNCGHLELVGVSSRYNTDDEGNGVLRDVTLDIAGGTKVGIVGRTGSGKSSLFLTILHLLNYTGEITIDGYEISDIPRHILRSRITTIAQDLMNLPSSIRDNVVPWEMGKPQAERLDDRVIVAALRRVGLNDQILARGGLDASVDDVGLSNGQRQLLALARAIVHNGQTKGKLVLVDEATSGIDTACEEKMQAVMAEVFEDCTVLTIAHRLSTMNSAGMLLEMSDGRLIHDGDDDDE